MGRVRGNHREERLAASLGINPPQRLAKEHVRAVALRSFESTIMKDSRVEVSVTGRVAAAARVTLADAPGAMNEDLVKSEAVGLILRLVAQMPLAKESLVTIQVE